MYSLHRYFCRGCILLLVATLTGISSSWADSVSISSPTEAYAGETKTFTVSYTATSEDTIIKAKVKKVGGADITPDICIGVVDTGSGTIDFDWTLPANLTADDEYQWYVYTTPSYWSERTSAHTGGNFTVKPEVSIISQAAATAGDTITMRVKYNATADNTIIKAKAKLMPSGSYLPEITIATVDAGPGYIDNVQWTVPATASVEDEYGWYIYETTTTWAERDATSFGGNFIVKGDTTTHDDVADMVADTSLAVNDIVDLNGYYSSGDGGAHRRVIASTNSGTGIALNNGLYANLASADETLNVRWFGARGDGTGNDAPFFDLAITQSQGTGQAIYVPSGSYYFTDSVQVPGNSTILGVGSSSKILTDWDTSAAFETTEHCDTPAEFDNFESNIQIYDLWFEMNETRPEGGLIFIRWVGYRGYNVRNVKVEGCHFENLAGVYITHARRIYGTYDANISSNNNPNLDPAVLAGFGTDESDLNKNIVFNNNTMFMPIADDDYKVLGQMLRVEFVTGVRAYGNTSTRGAMSGWGGNAQMTNGGELQHYRRLRDVIFQNNDLYEPNAMYFICGENSVMINNTIENCIDVGYDFEGCINSVVAMNYVKNTANGSLATFYDSYKNTYKDNTCIEDGSAQDINDEFNIGGKWDPANNDTFYLNTGAHTPSDGEDEALVTRNTFTWEGATGSGFIDSRDMSVLVIRNNVFENVCIKTAWNNTGQAIIEDNTLTITQDAGREALIHIGDNRINTDGPILDNNTVTISAPQTDGSSGPSYIVKCYQEDNSSWTNTITNNSFALSGSGSIAGDIAVQNNSSNAGRVHTYIISGNELTTSSPLVDLSSRNFPHIFYLTSNTNGSDPAITWEYANAAWGDDKGFGFLSGTELPGETSGGKEVADDGIWLNSSHAWSAGSYTEGDLVYSSSGKVYWRTTTGSSTTEPVGSYPTGWFYLGTNATGVGDLITWDNL